MPTFIKAGFWEKLCQKCTGYKGWLNLDQFVKDNSSLSYKVYTALLTQESSDAPVATVLENTLGGTPVWTRTSAGTYLCTLTGAFPVNKTFCSVTYGPNSGTVPLIPLFGAYGVADADNLMLQFLEPNTIITPIDPNNYAEDDICIEIRVYP